jgi:hypothetical protein
LSAALTSALLRISSSTSRYADAEKDRAALWRGVRLSLSAAMTSALLCISSSMAISVLLAGLSCKGAKDCLLDIVELRELAKTKQDIYYNIALLTIESLVTATLQP